VEHRCADNAVQPALTHADSVFTDEHTMGSVHGPPALPTYPVMQMQSSLVREPVTDVEKGGHASHALTLGVYVPLDE